MKGDHHTVAAQKTGGYFEEFLKRGFCKVFFISWHI